MSKKMLLFLLVCCCWGASVCAAELRVAEASITTAIENQQPVDQIQSYPADFGKLYCFTRIVGATGDTSVIHVWYFQEHEMARVSLPIGSGNWRTYSSKRFLPQWEGQWQVKVFDSEGKELAKIPFALESY